MDKRKKAKLLLNGLTVFFLLVFVVSGVLVLKTVRQGKREEDAFRVLEDSVSAQAAPERETSTPAPAQSESDAPEEAPVPVTYTRYLSLYEQNQDFAGWLSVGGTGIDYPVMCTPEDPEYYLHRAFDGSDSKSGTPFIGAGSSADSDYFIIYGHNMKNDTMFGTLDYFAEQSFCASDPGFSFTTVEEEREYEIFAAVKTRILNQNEAGYRYYSHAGDLTEEDFAELIDWLKEHSLYDTGITPAYGEQIVVLSTCSYHDVNGRFLIAARRIRTAD